MSGKTPSVVLESIASSLLNENHSNHMPDPLAPFRTDRLFILVGNNPLPNAVAALALSVVGGTVITVCTQGTRGVAVRFGTWLQKMRPDLQIADRVEVADSDPSSIQSGVESALAAIPPGQTVGLHYTGGTKAMAVFAHRAVSSVRPDATPSYLDARTLRLRFDPPSGSRIGSSIYTGPDATGPGVRIWLDDLLTLHGWTYYRNWKPSGAPPLLDTANLLCEMDLRHGDKGTAEGRAWRAWRNTWWKKWDDESRKAGTAYSGNERPTFLDYQLVLPTAPTLSLIARALQNGLGHAVKDGAVRLGDAKTAAGFATASDFCRWLDGSWMESVVLDRLLAVVDQCQLHDVAMGLNIRKIEAKELLFEFDVVALRGYQLFALSCSTSSNYGELKRKVFEASARAHQLGGSEARVALVCTSDASTALENQLRGDLPADRVRVFGKKHLPDLSGHFTAWITGESGTP